MNCGNEFLGMISEVQEIKSLISCILSELETLIHQRTQLRKKKGNPQSRETYL